MKRFGIRALLFVMLLTAYFVGRPLHRGRMQRQARAWVESQHGHSLFKYDIGPESQWYTTDSELAVPNFLVRALGVDAFNPVETVIFDCDELTTFAPLCGMDSLQNIYVNIEIAEEIEFAPLAEIPSLRSLHFTRWAFITDSQLAEVRASLPHVEVVAESDAGS